MGRKISHKAYICLGSNLGDKSRYLENGLKALQKISIGKVICSPVYETKPIGPVEQDNFFNLVAQIETTFTPRELLRYLLETELENGRKRSVRFGPRTLDMDILLYDDTYVCNRDLQIPHTRMWERAFVLVPLAVLAPDRRGLGGQTFKTLAKKLLENCVTEGDVRYVGRFWQEAPGLSEVETLDPDGIGE